MSLSGSSSVSQGTPILARIGVAPLLFVLSLSADQPVSVKLVEAGRDVTHEHSGDRVRFISHRKEPDGKTRAETECLVSQVCMVKPGAYSITVDSEDFVVEVRPQLVVEPADTLPFLVAVPLVPAAHIAVRGVPAGGMLQALDIRTASLYSSRGNGATTRLRVPAGRVVLCAYDASKRPLGCWPVAATAGESVPLESPPRLGRKRGQLLAGFKYPNREPAHDLSVSLRVGEKVVPPDAVVTVHPDRHFAVWYDAPAGTGRLELMSKLWTATAGDLSVDVPERGTNVVWAIPVVRRPEVRVAFQNGDVLGPGDIEVDVLTCGEPIDRTQPPPMDNCKTVATRRGTHRGAFVFSDLSPSLYALRWRKPPLLGVDWLDLSDGKSRDEMIPLQLREVHGRVSQGGKDLPARVSILAPNPGIRAATRTDERGQYQLVVAQPGLYFMTVRTGDGRSVSRPCTLEEDARETTCDVDVPANAVVVSVQTEDGRATPPSTSVDWDLTGPPPSNERLDFGYGLAPASDGNIVLPPLAEGTLSVRARAEGYRVSSATPLVVTKELADTRVTIVLRKGSGRLLRIVDPSGQPARGALVWSGAHGCRADGEGIARFEESLVAGSPLIAFDGGGHMLFTRAPSEDAEVLQIPPSAPPVTVRLRSPDGAPVANTGVLIAVDGILDDRRFLDQCLACGGQQVSGPDGVVRICGLPGSGLLTVFPFGRPDLRVERALPVGEEIVIGVPLPEGGKGSR